jgi:hypothetical protein
VPPVARKRSQVVLGGVVFVVVALVLTVVFSGGHLPAVLTTNTQAPQLGSFAGYIQFGDVNRISATWTVPAISATSSDGGASTWIGVQGQGTTEFYQIGTTENRENGQLFYDAFWSDPVEGFHAQYMPVSVAAGDEIKASIARVSGHWLATIDDVTSGQKQAAPTGTGVFTNLSLAEWIQEDPSLPHNGHVPYPQIGPMTMWQLKANGTAPSYAGLQPQWMVLPHAQRVVPGPLINDRFTTRQAPESKL